MFGIAFAPFTPAPSRSPRPLRSRLTTKQGLFRSNLLLSCTFTILQYSALLRIGTFGFNPVVARGAERFQQRIIVPLQYGFRVCQMVNLFGPLPTSDASMTITLEDSASDLVPQRTGEIGGFVVAVTKSVENCIAVFGKLA